MDVVFFGSGAFGLPTLRSLADAHDVRAVVSQPNRPAGRGGKTTPTPIAQLAESELVDVPLLRPERVNAVEVVNAIRAVPAEAWVVIAFGQKLGRDLLADRFAINLHASLLPRWRGAAPINAAIMAGDKESGLSVITLADRMDAGLVLGSRSHPIESDVTAGQLHDQLAAGGPDLIASVLEQHASGALRAVEQDESQVTLAPKLSKKDGWVDFGDSAEACRRRINGLSPWPGVTTTFRSAALKLVRSELGGVDPESGMEPGVVLDGRAGLVACGGSVLRLLEVQPPGKRAMTWSEFARGRQVEAGERLGGSAEA